MFQKNEILNIKYFMDLGLHLGNRVHNRATWMQGFILGSRGSSCDVLNVQELLKRLERLGPIIIHTVRNGGTILIINRMLDTEVSYLSKIFKLRPFSNVVNVFTDRWIDGAFSNFLNFKFLNLRQLPSLVFLSDFTDSKNLLDEAYFLRIPVVALVDTRVHTDTILQKIFMPLPSSNSIKSLFFFFNFLKHYVEKGLYCRDYVGTRDLLFQN
jgi:ribosomal protein S2